MAQRLPELPVATPSETQRWADELVRTLDQLGVGADRACEVAQRYAVSNYTVTRTLDASTATLSDLLDVFCTLVSDLQSRRGA